MKYNCDYGEETLYELFRFFCPNTRKRITMLETSFANTKLFWEARYENILDRYVAKENFKNTYKDNALFYAYTPMAGEGDELSDRIAEAVATWQKQGYVATLVVPEKIKDAILRGGLEDRFVTIWALEDKFFNICHGTKYGSILAELNIMNEAVKWKSCKMFSIYPTVAKTFTYIGGRLDWEAVEQAVVF